MLASTEKEALTLHLYTPRDGTDTYIHLNGSMRKRWVFANGARRTAGIYVRQMQGCCGMDICQRTTEHMHQALGNRGLQVQGLAGGG